MDIVICGCVRNCETYIDKVFENILKIKTICNLKKVVLAYDESSDKTLLKLINLKKNHRDIEIDILINRNKLHSQRTQNISNARNQIMRQLKQVNFKIDYYIMMDFDDVCALPIDITVLQNALNDHEKWDCVTFNNKNYYDFWALSIGPFKYSCWHWTNPHEIIRLMNTHLQKEFESTSDYVYCDSAFNGFGVYKYDVFKDCVYNCVLTHNMIDYDSIIEVVRKYMIQPIIRHVIYDVEHKPLHTNAVNARKAISKECLFEPYLGDHASFLRE